MDDPGLVARLETCVERLEKIGEDHETRLRTLETKGALIAGAIALAVFIVPVLISIVK